MPIVSDVDLHVMIAYWDSDKEYHPEIPPSILRLPYYYEVPYVRSCVLLVIHFILLLHGSIITIGIQIKIVYVPEIFKEEYLYLYYTYTGLIY